MIKYITKVISAGRKENSSSSTVQRGSFHAIVWDITQITASHPCEIRCNELKSVWLHGAFVQNPSPISKVPMLMVDCWRVKQYSYSQAIINLRWSCKETLNISHRYVEGLFISSQKVRLLDCTDSHDWSIINGSKSIIKYVFVFNYLIYHFIEFFDHFLLTKLKIYSHFLLPSDIHLYTTSEKCYFT